jgi:hypothetical protein
MKSYVFMDRINRIYQLELYQIWHFAAVAETPLRFGADRHSVEEPTMPYLRLDRSGSSRRVCAISMQT